jgi:uncharacterized protein (UPF0332 family)
VLDDNKTALMRLRLEQARESLNSALLLLDAGAYRDSANRSYYSIFHLMRAVLALDGYDSKKHSGIISEFGIRYIKTERIPKEFSKVIQKAFKIRNDSDYNDFYVVLKEDVIQQSENAKAFLVVVEAYIKTL